MNKPEIATQHGTTWSRRDWLKMAALGAAALALPGRSSGAPAAGRIPIALQLYSIRKECGQNFDQALEAAAKMGLDGVEFAGYYKYGQDAAGLRKRSAIGVLTKRSPAVFMAVFIRSPPGNHLPAARATGQGPSVRQYARHTRDAEPASACPSSGR